MTRANFQDLPVSPPDRPDPVWVASDRWVWDLAQAPARHADDCYTNAPEADWFGITEGVADIATGKKTHSPADGKYFRVAFFLSWPSGDETFLCADTHGQGCAQDTAESMIEGLGWEPLRLETREDIEADRDAQSN